MDEFGVPLPDELRALLARPPEVDGGPIEIDLTGRSLSVGLEELFPTGLPIAHDGSGNVWLLT